MDGPALECVINLSEGRRPGLVAAIAATAGDAVLDVHCDAAHNRSVVTLVEWDPPTAAQQVARAALAQLSLEGHVGVHPRLGVVDVVPFVPLVRGRVMPDADLGAALAARDAFAHWAGDELGLPCFVYGPEQSLPELRRRAFVDLAPTTGPRVADPRAGAICVGARPPLVAYNLWLAGADLSQARQIARSIRRPGLRTLGFDVGEAVQVSCNLIDPFRIGPGAVFDAVSAAVRIERAELVGLVPEGVLHREPARRWRRLGLSAEATVEARLVARGRGSATRSGASPTRS